MCTSIHPGRRHVPAALFAFSALLFSTDVHAQQYEIVDLGGAFGSVSSGARDINNAGQVVGWATKNDGNFAGYLWQAGAMMPLPPPPDLQPGVDFVFSLAGINRQGVVVGYCRRCSSPSVRYVYLWNAKGSL